MNLKKAIRYVMTITFPLIGIMHFTNPSPFLAIIPSGLPWPLALVYISGLFEILFGIGLITKYRKHAWISQRSQVEIYAWSPFKFNYNKKQKEKSQTCKYS